MGMGCEDCWWAIENDGSYCKFRKQDGSLYYARLCTHPRPPGDHIRAGRFETKGRLKTCPTMKGFRPLAERWNYVPTLERNRKQPEDACLISWQAAEGPGPGREDELCADFAQNRKA